MFFVPYGYEAFFRHRPPLALCIDDVKVRLTTDQKSVRLGAADA